MDTLARLAAESEVRNVIARIAHLADDGDLTEYLSLFTKDAIWQMPGGAARKGHDDILAGALERRASGIQGPGSDTRHVNTTLWVRIDDADNATAQSYYLFLGNCSSNAELRLTGRYDDKLRREDGVWKMAHRTIKTDVNAPTG